MKLEFRSRSACGHCWRFGSALQQSSKLLCLVLLRNCCGRSTCTVTSYALYNHRNSETFANWFCLQLNNWDCNVHLSVGFIILLHQWTVLFSNVNACEKNSRKMHTRTHTHRTYLCFIFGYLSLGRELQNLIELPELILGLSMLLYALKWVQPSDFIF